MKEKCYIIENENGYLTKYGTNLTSDNNKPTVVYLRSKIKITPKLKQQSFENEINSVKSELQQFINKELQNNSMFENRHLCNIELSAKSVSYKKISYMRIDLYIRPIIPQTLIENQPIIKELSLKIKQETYRLFDKYNIKCCAKTING